MPLHGLRGSAASGHQDSFVECLFHSEQKKPGHAQKIRQPRKNKCQDSRAPKKPQLGLFLTYFSLILRDVIDKLTHATLKSMPSAPNKPQIACREVRGCMQLLFRPMYAKAEINEKGRQRLSPLAAFVQMAEKLSPV
jgi:hypothetical protein